MDNDMSNRKGFVRKNKTLDLTCSKQQSISECWKSKANKILNETTESLYLDKWEAGGNNNNQW